MKRLFRGRGAVYWYAADAVAIVVAITYSDWALPVAAWLSVVATFVCCGRIPVWQRS